MFRPPSSTDHSLHGLRLNLSTSACKFERLEGLAGVMFLQRQRADYGNVRIATDSILEEMSELRVAVWNV
jgi:hypothetical protein